MIDHTGSHDFLRYISKEMIPNDLNYWDCLPGGNSPGIFLQAIYWINVGIKILHHHCKSVPLGRSALLRFPVQVSEVFESAEVEMAIETGPVWIEEGACE